MLFAGTLGVHLLLPVEQRLMPGPGGAARCSSEQCAAVLEPSVKHCKRVCRSLGADHLSALLLERPRWWARRPEPSLLAGGMVV